VAGWLCSEGGGFSSRWIVGRDKSGRIRAYHELWHNKPLVCPPPPPPLHTLTAKIAGASILYNKQQF